MPENTPGTTEPKMPRPERSTTRTWHPRPSGITGRVFENYASSVARRADRGAHNNRRRTLVNPLGIGHG
jgi:hypothetical protein